MLRHHFLLLIAHMLKQSVILVHTHTYICVGMCVCAYGQVCVKELYISHLICVLQGNIVIGYYIKRI
jgi:hypothetical protein